MSFINRFEVQSRREFVVAGWRLGAASIAGAALGPPALAQTLPMRQEADAVDAGKMAKLQAAVKEMKDRSAKKAADPKGWLAIAESHRAFCSTPGPNGASQIHGCYWFLPWHRAYIAVTERKIREIANDSSLAFPYWNWSVNRRLPKAFQSGALSMARRYTQNVALEDGQVDFIRADPELSKLGVAALSARKFEATAKPTLQDFRLELRDAFGGVARPNSLSKYGNGRPEGTPHGDVHVYVGGFQNGQVGDMGDFATAARDPVFFAHHGNLDRLWERWRSSAANKATEPTSKAFLDHEFVFPWLDGSPMVIKVSDTMDTKLLGYAYDSLDVLKEPAVGPVVPMAAPDVGLPPVISAPAKVPAVPLAAGEKPRFILSINELSSPGRNMSAGVYVAPASQPGRRVLVGSVSFVRNDGKYDPALQGFVFDITAAVKQFATSDLVVAVVPHRIGGEDKLPYKSLQYKSVSIIAQKQ